MTDDFGDRMKMFEGAEASRRLLPLVPVCVRIDGKGFSSWTEGLKRPYDERLSEVMVKTTEYLVKQSNAVIGYTQSDEISLIIYSDSLDNQIYFDGKIQKLVSVLASTATAKFNELVPMAFGLGRPLAIFDCRVWSVPSKVEATNTLLWREQDASKNSISMSARHYFEHKELHGKTGPEMQEMMFSKHGVNWNDYPAFFKRGTFVQTRFSKRMLSEEEMVHIPIEHRPTEPILRSKMVRLDMPPFSKVINRVEVVFDKADPIVATE